LSALEPIPDPTRADHTRPETLDPCSERRVGSDQKDGVVGSLCHSSESVIAGLPSVNYFYAIDHAFLNACAGLPFQYHNDRRG
jgi:hypothetical protein